MERIRKQYKSITKKIRKCQKILRRIGAIATAMTYIIVLMTLNQSTTN